MAVNIKAGCIDINIASKEDLVRIRHIGESRAEQIIELRKQEVFKSMDDLNRVYGIGPARISDIKEQGLTCFYYKEQLIEDIYSPTEVIKKEPEPEINLFYPEKNQANKKIEIVFSVSGLENSDYDLKISIETEKNISNIYNKKEDRWQSSRYYINNLFSGNSFKETLILKITEENLNFEGEADLIARIRENGKTNYLEYKSKINIVRPENKIELNEDDNIFSKNNTANISQLVFSKNILTGLMVALFSGTAILTIKRKLEKT